MTSSNTPTLDAIDDRLGEVDCVAANTGYFSQANVEVVQQRTIDPYIATGRKRTINGSTNI